MKLGISLSLTALRRRIAGGPGFRDVFAILMR
jgi:hypothetical protein